MNASSPFGSGDGDATAPTLPRPDGADAGGAPTPSQTGALGDGDFAAALRCNKLRTVFQKFPFFSFSFILAVLILPSLFAASNLYTQLLFSHRTVATMSQQNWKKQ